MFSPDSSDSYTVTTWPLLLAWWSGKKWKSEGVKKRKGERVHFLSEYCNPRGNDKFQQEGTEPFRDSEEIKHSRFSSITE